MSRTTSRLAKDRDPRWVSTKGCNVVSYPFKRKTLIKQSYVLSHSWKSWKAEYVDTVAGTRQSHEEVPYLAKKNLGFLQDAYFALTITTSSLSAKYCPLNVGFFVFSNVSWAN